MILLMGEEEANKLEEELMLQEAKIEEMVPSDDELQVDNIFEQEMQLIN